MRKPNLSIQQRITLWYVLVFLFLWIYLSSEAHRTVQNRLEREVYQELDRKWAFLENAASHQGKLTEEDLEQLHLVDLFQANDIKGHLHQSRGWSQNNLHHALRNGSFNPYGSWIESQGRSRRLYYLKVLPSPGSMTPDAVAIDATGMIQDVITAQASANWWSFLLAGLLVVPGGYWVVGWILKPIKAIFLKAFEIDAKRISSRLPRINPEDEIGQLVFALNLTLDRLKKDFEQIQRFSANASHQLRTPLAIIRSLGEVALQTDESSATYRETISSMLEELSRLSRLVDGLLLLSRAESGQIPLDRQRVDLSAMTQSTVELLSILATEKRQHLSFEKQDHLWVVADPMLFSQAISNVLDNAVHHTPETGLIRVAVHRLNQRTACVDIIDSGPGIPRSERLRVFEHFYRLPTQDKASGAGLGLAISNWVVHANGGTIEFLDPESAGAWCRITLPLAPAESSPAA
jgi:signal transduction histidine kinase